MHCVTPNEFTWLVQCIFDCMYILSDHDSCLSNYCTANNYWLNLLLCAASRYGAILIPSSPGALHDLAQNTELAKLLNAFVHEKSE